MASTSLARAQSLLNTPYTLPPMVREGPKTARLPKQYFLFLRDHRTAFERQQHRFEGFPDEDDSITYTYHSRRLIANAVNSVFQEGVADLFPRVPFLLAPLSMDLYETDFSRVAMNARVLMIWRSLTPALRRRFDAEYSVSFYIPSHSPYAAAHLAFFLLQFSYTAIRTYVTAHYEFDVRRQPQLKGLAYHLTTAADAVSYPRYGSHPISGLPLSTWPPHDTELVQEQTVLKCFHHTTPTFSVGTFESVGSFRLAPQGHSLFVR
ncbi:hypothetical protein VTO73DRAFT_10842 [Trametes versicolor]